MFWEEETLIVSPKSQHFWVGTRKLSRKIKRLGAASRREPSRGNTTHAYPTPCMVRPIRSPSRFMRGVFVRVEPHLRIAFVEPHVDRHCRRGTTPADRLSRNWTPHPHVAFVDTETRMLSSSDGSDQKLLSSSTTASTKKRLKIHK
jgi:DNA topoisomerase VI subunit B